MQKETGVSSAKTIIEMFLSSEIMADIVLFFRSNPQLIVNGNQIASKVGRNFKLIEGDLEKLVELGILRTEKSERQNWYAFDVERDWQIQRVIETYILDFEDS